MKGKNKCKILKEIRQKIADENDIPYVTRECSYQGECTGTCPKCEAELRYLEQELEKRRSLGKTVAVAAVAAGLSLSMAACVPGKGSGSAGNISAAIASIVLPMKLCISSTVNCSLRLSDASLSVVPSTLASAIWEATVRFQIRS